MEEGRRFRVAKNALDPEPVLEALWAMNEALSRLRWELVAQARAAKLAAKGDAESREQAIPRLPRLRVELARVNECTQPFLDHVNAILPSKIVEPTIATSEPRFDLAGPESWGSVSARARSAANVETALLYLNELVETADVETFLEEAVDDPLLRGSSLATQAFVVNYETIDHARALVLDLRAICGAILQLWKEGEAEAAQGA